MTDAGTAGGLRRPAPAAPAVRRAVSRPVNWLLLLPLIGTLVPEFYNRTTPALGGMPFFYWYQLVWIAVSVACTWAVYRANRGRR